MHNEIHVGDYVYDSHEEKSGYVISIIDIARCVIQGDGVWEAVNDNVNVLPEEKQDPNVT